jgi:hypothetical protein
VRMLVCQVSADIPCGFRYLHPLSERDGDA